MTALSRGVDGLEVTTDEQSIIRTALADWTERLTRIIVATGVAFAAAGRGPEKTLKSLLIRMQSPTQFALNATGPALVLKHALRLMPRRQAVGLRGAVRPGRVDRRQPAGGLVFLPGLKGRAKPVDPHRRHRSGARPPSGDLCGFCIRARWPPLFTENYRNHETVPAAGGRGEPARRDGRACRAADTGGFFDWAGNEVAW